MKTVVLTQKPGHLVRLVCFAVFVAVVAPASAQTLAWERAFSSTHGGDFGYGVAVDATGVYVVGWVPGGGVSPGQTSVGGWDAFISKYDLNGNELWTRQFGTTVDDIAYAVAAGGGGVYVVGETGGTFPGQAQSFSTDAFVRKYDPNGNELWTRQFGTTGADFAFGVATDASGVYVVGETDGTLPGQTAAGTVTAGDAFIRKYDHNGTELWTSQFGTPGYDRANAVAVNATGVYVVGDAGGVLPNAQIDSGYSNFFVRKYDVNGNAQWTRQFGPGIHARGAAVDNTGVYVVGNLGGGALPGQTSSGGYDGFVKKYDLAGNVQWTHQYGTGVSDIAYAAAADGTGVYVAGATTRALPGQTNLGGQDAYVRKYDASGNEIWTRQFGTNGADQAYAVTVNPSGVYVAGNVGGPLPGQTTGGDIFVAKIAFGPVLFDGGVVNNASFAKSPAPVAPGSIAAVFGTGLNDGSTVLFSSFGSDGKLVTTLGGASVTVNNISAPMFYSTPGQLGIQIPFELATLGAATLQVTVGGQASAPITIAVDALAPGLFTATQDGKGAAVALHSDGVTPVTTQNPAKPNEVLVLVGTGLGLLSPSLATGAPSQGNPTVILPGVTVDGISAEVQFAGGAPGFVGLDQINIRIPPGMRTATNIPMVLNIGTKQSNTVTIAVSQ
jgi:uncharacterized protein (TIGR03437 family)